MNGTLSIYKEGLYLLNHMKEAEDARNSLVAQKTSLEEERNSTKPAQKGFGTKKYFITILLMVISILGFMAAFKYYLEPEGLMVLRYIHIKDAMMLSNVNAICIGIAIFFLLVLIIELVASAISRSKYKKALSKWEEDTSFDEKTKLIDLKMKSVDTTIRLTQKQYDEKCADVIDEKDANPEALQRLIKSIEDGEMPIEEEDAMRKKAEASRDARIARQSSGDPERSEDELPVPTESYMFKRVEDSQIARAKRLAEEGRSCDIPESTPESEEHSSDDLQALSNFGYEDGDDFDELEGYDEAEEEAKLEGVPQSSLEPSEDGETENVPEAISAQFEDVGTNDEPDTIPMPFADIETESEPESTPGQPEGDVTEGEPEAIQERPEEEQIEDAPQPVLEPIEEDSIVEEEGEGPEEETIDSFLERTIAEEDADETTQELPVLEFNMSDDDFDKIEESATPVEEDGVDIAEEVTGGDDDLEVDEELPEESEEELLTESEEDAQSVLSKEARREAEHDAFIAKYVDFKNNTVDLEDISFADEELLAGLLDRKVRFLEQDIADYHIRGNEEGEIEAMVDKDVYEKLWQIVYDDLVEKTEEDEEEATEGCLLDEPCEDAVELPEKCDEAEVSESCPRDDKPTNIGEEIQRIKDTSYEEGVDLEKLTTIKRGWKLGLDVDVVAVLTDLSVDKVKRIYKLFEL